MTGKCLFEFRKRKGLEKKQLAFLLSCAPRTISNLENNIGREIKDNYVFMVKELENLIPDIKDVLVKRIAELRSYGHAV